MSDEPESGLHRSAGKSLSRVARDARAAVIAGDAFFSGGLTPTRSEKLRATDNKTVQVDGVALERGSPSVPR
jgi:hypothetical protein